jgi:hypothetical protein
MNNWNGFMCFFQHDFDLAKQSHTFSAERKELAFFLGL